MPRAYHEFLPPAWARVESLFARYDGPVPAPALTAAVAAAPAAIMSRRTYCDEIDHAARDLVNSISAVRARMPGIGQDVGGTPRQLDDLAGCLRYYRDLGVSL